MIYEQIMAQGEWEISFAGLPHSLVDSQLEFSHILILPNHINPNRMSDTSLLNMSRFTGIVYQVTRPRFETDEITTLTGPSIAAYLGDSEGIGEVITVDPEFRGVFFHQAIEGLLPPSLTAGFLSLAFPTQTYSADHYLQSPRDAISSVCEEFQAEWRVNPDGTFDAGKPGELFVTTPEAVMVRRGPEYDPNLRGIVPSSMEVELDSSGWVSEVLIAGKTEATGTDFIVGQATLADIGQTNPYVNLKGDPLTRRIVVDEPRLNLQQMDPRAQIRLQERIKRINRISLDAPNFLIQGDFKVGDTIWCYDPPHLLDLSNTQSFEGTFIHPIAIRVFGLQWPVVRGMGVLLRHPDGTYTDLTPYVVWETGTVTRVDVGDRLDSPFATSTDGVGFRLPPEDITLPDVPTHINLPWTGYQYLDAQGKPLAAIVVEWATPLNVDGSTILDGAYYSIRWRKTGTTDYSYVAVPWGENRFALANLPTGVDFDISVEAVDLAGNRSGFAPNQTVTAPIDNLPPSKPAPPIVVGGPLVIQVEHRLAIDRGGSTGEFDLEIDTVALDVYADLAPNLPIVDSTKVVSLAVTAGNFTQKVPVLGSFPVDAERVYFVRVVAVDSSGNRSVPSDPTSITGVLVDERVITGTGLIIGPTPQTPGSVFLSGTIRLDGIVTLTGTLIAPGMIIDANQVTRITNLNAEEITTGFLSADRINVLDTLSATGTITLDGLGKIVTADSGARVEITQELKDRIVFYNDVDDLVGSIGFLFPGVESGFGLEATAPGNLVMKGGVRFIDINDERVVDIRPTGVHINTGHDLVMPASEAGSPSIVANNSLTGIGISSPPLQAWEEINLITNSVPVIRVREVGTDRYQALFRSGTFSAPGLAFQDSLGTGVSMSVFQKVSLSGQSTHCCHHGSTHNVLTPAFFPGLRVDAGGVDARVVNGELTAASSSQRYKDSVTPLNPAAHLSLDSFEPISYRLKDKVGPSSPYLGFTAEQVAAQNPPAGLVVEDDEGPVGFNTDGWLTLIVQRLQWLTKKVEALEQR